MPTLGPYTYVSADGKTDAELYLTDIYDGKIVACQDMKRLADIMLPRFDEPYKQWHYDVEKATRPVRWIEKFTCFPEGEKMGQPFILEDYERMAIELGFGFVDDDDIRQIKQVLMMLARKCGKALSLDTEIPTPGGWRLMRDIHVGDVVFGQDGKPSTVIAESEIFDKPMYFVTFEDGATIKASGDHVWTVRRDNSEPWQDLTTETIADTLGTRLYYVPACEPVRYEEKEYDVPPYAYAVEHWDERIPDEYLQGSVMQRTAYLCGLFEACGSEMVCWDTASLHFNDLAAVESCMELLASLGYTHNKLRKHCGGWNYVVKYWPAVTGNVKWITGVERIPNEPSKCIAIDNESHLYLAGRNYTATHNTSMLAALMLYMLCDGEKGGEVFCCANSESQARKCFGAADAMRIHSPALNKRLRRGKVQKRGSSGINYDKTGSFLAPIAANVGKLDGLSASAIVYDELAAATDNGALLDILTESTSARRQPLTWIISTENYVRYNIWDERIAYSEGWLKGEIKDDTFLPILFRLDSYEDLYLEENWPKASPGLLCGIKSWQYIRDRVNMAKQSPARMPSLLTKEFNLRANSASTFLSKEECISNTEPFEFNPKTDRYCCIGFDLSTRGDLTSACAIWRRPGDDRLYEITRSWIPEEQVKINAAKDFKERDGVPYHLWATKQSCGMPIFEIVEGDKIDQRVILNFIRELAEMGLYPRYVGFDPWHVDDWTLRELKMMVGENNVEPIAQQAKILSPAMRELQLDLRAKRVCCNNAEPLIWARGNLQTKPPDANNNLFPQKRDLSAHNKIDPVMAEIFGRIAMERHLDDYLAAVNG